MKRLLEGKLVKKAVRRLTTLVSRRLWGVEAMILPQLVEQLGPWDALRWFARNLPPYERAIRDIGPLRTNLICCAASMFNGCAYCTYACSYAFELHYFAQYDKLFPLDDQQFLSLIQLTDDQVREELDAALDEAGLSEEKKILQRLYKIKLEGAEPKPDEHFLVHAIKMFDDLNFCSIDAQLSTDEAHDRINRDGDLRVRYAKARLEANRRRMRFEEMLEPSSK
jgi:hypothetical protein